MTKPEMDAAYERITAFTNAITANKDWVMYLTSY
jgi:hypothetical protein